MRAASWRAARLLGSATLLIGLAAAAAMLAGVPAGPDAERVLAATSVSLVYLGGTGLVLARHRRKQADFASAALPAGGAAADGAILVTFTSQTGFAEELALRTAEALRGLDHPVRLLPLDTVDTEALAAAACALFVVSTTGEGDPPDTAARFSRRVMGQEPQLSGLHYGLLALGDSSYARYCAFGRALDAWLRRHHATPMFDAVEVDDGDPSALRHWQHQLGRVATWAGGRPGAGADVADWSKPTYDRWRLADRRLLNPGSPGGAAFHIALEPLQGTADWQAGDIAEIGPRNPPDEVAALLRQLGVDGAAVLAEGTTLAEALAASRLPRDAAEARALLSVPPERLAAQLQALPHREYSIASLPADGRLELLVRQARQPDGSLGLGSGWLTAHAAIGGEIALRIRRNRAFHAPPDDRPMILIGSGTGLAGLRAHIKARAEAGRRRNWLLFGERTAAHDFFHREEIAAWREAGVLSRLDVIFSRDGGDCRYVQHRLAAAAADVQAWIDDGASLYVCGSLRGMAEDVGVVLTDILGAEVLASLSEEGRYRRDVY